MLYIDYIESGLGYAAWIRRFGSPDEVINPWARIASKAPVLIARLTSVSIGVRDAIRELQQRLELDRNAIFLHFQVHPDEGVRDLDGPLSDPHGNGRSVVRIRFESGKSIIYKPKPLAIEAQVNAFLANHGKTFGLRALQILDKGRYGYAEDAGSRGPPQAVESRDGEAIGRAAAFFWLLNATDMHVENLLLGSEIACLDLETLFSPPTIGLPLESHRWRQHTVTSTLLFDGSAFAHSRTGNVSGFHPSIELKLDLPDVAFQMRNDQLTINVSGPSNEPNRSAFVDKDSIPLSFLHRVHYGFTQAAGLQAREQLRLFVETLDPNTPLRFVARETAFYGRIMERLRQPRLLRSAETVREDIATLHKSVKSDQPGAVLLHRLIDHEIEQLYACDVPYFTYHLGGLDLRLPCNTGVSAFSQSAKSMSLEKIVGVEDSDIKEQHALIQIALGFGPPRSRLNTPNSDTRARLRAIAHRLIDTAYRPASGSTRWLTLSGDVSKSDLRVGIGGRSLFSGSSGIVLALQAADRILDDPKVSDFLNVEVERWVQTSNRYSSDRHATALGFSGIGGDLLAMAELIYLAPERWGFLQEELHSTLRYSTAAIPHDSWLDVMLGSAGLVLSLLRLQSVVSDGNTFHAITAALSAGAAHLVSSARPQDTGAAWITPFEPSPLLGYAHGWAGIAAALTGARSALSAINESQLAFNVDESVDRSLEFVASCINDDGVPTERRASVASARPLNGSWCNGIPGFLRGCSAVADRIDPALQASADSIYGAFIDQIAIGQDLRFCCGTMGAIDTALDLATLHGDSRARRIAVTAGHTTVAQAVCDADSPRGSLRPEVAFPGLYQSLGGILYTGCRIIEPEIRSLSGQTFIS